MVTNGVPTQAPTNAPVVAYMMTLFSGWDLNEGETDAVLAAFFLVCLLVLVAIIYFSYVFFTAPASPKSAVVTQAAAAPENRPLINKAAPQPSKQYAKILKEKVGNSFGTGFACQMYTGKGTKAIKLWLQGKKVCFQSNTTFSRDLNEIDLSTVTSVQVGKSTDNIRKAAPSIPDEQCFSLMINNNSMDISVSKKEDRDMLANGFTELVENVKSGQV